MTVYQKAKDELLILMLHTFQLAADNRILEKAGPHGKIQERDLDELALSYTWPNRSEVINIKLQLPLVEIKNAEVSYSPLLILSSLGCRDISGL